jgi:hypothetical protein
MNGQENKIIYVTGLSQNWYLKKDQVSQRNKKNALAVFINRIWRPEI